MTYGPIEELLVPYDGTRPQQKVARRRRRLVGRIISLIITVVILVALYLWQREAFGPGLWVVYGVLFGVSVGVAGGVRRRLRAGEAGAGLGP